MLQRLKEQGELIKLAEQLISHSNLNNHDQHRLRSYFTLTLEPDPTSRISQLEDVFAKIEVRW